MILLKKDNLIVSTLLSFVVFTMPFGLVNNLNPIAIILLTVYSVLLTIRKRNISFCKNEFQVLPLAYFLFFIVTLTYTKNFGEDLKQLEKNLPFLIFPLLFFVLSNYINKETKDKIISFFILGNIAALLLCLTYSFYMFYWQSNSDPFNKGSFYFTGLFDLHPTYFSMYLTMCIVLIRTYLRKNKVDLKFVSKVLLMGLTFLLWISIIHLRSRSGILALLLIEIILITAAFIDRYPTLNEKTFWLIFMFFVIPITMNNKVYDFGKEYFKRDTNEAINERLKNWDASLSAISEAPILGNGFFGSSIVRDTFFYINGYDTGIDNRYNSHNQFIEITIIGGVLGLVILLLMLFKLLLLFKNKNDITVLCFFTLLIVIMMTESILVRQHGIVFFSFFYVFLNTNLNEK